MLSVEKAIKIILKDITISATEDIDILSTLSRVLSKDITSGRNIPSHDNTAMDGYAIQCADTNGAKATAPVMLRVIGEARAGSPFSKRITKGCAVKVMTGALIPDGADTVAKREDVREKGGFLFIKAPVKKAEYIRSAGEDVKKGDTILTAGKRLIPADIGILASMKKRKVSVYKKPTVGILCTGDELALMEERLKPGMVVSSNLYALISLAEAAGAEVYPMGIVRDDKRAIKGKLKSGFKHDFLLTTGGISVGDYDFVKESLKELGAKIKIFKVAMRPGKPFSYFTHGKTKIFALPGNPVSCLVSFLLFVRPAILKTLGGDSIFDRKIDAILRGKIDKIKGYKFFIRGIIKKEKGVYYVKPTGPQGSGILKSMSLANGLIIADSDRERIDRGETVKVIVLDDGFDLTRNF